MLSTEDLKKAYEEQTVLTLENSLYRLTIEGEEIKNYENALIEPIRVESKKNSVTVILNQEKPLPGSVRVTMKDNALFEACRHSYYYDESRGSYITMDVKKEGATWEADIAGRYLFCRERKEKLQWSRTHGVLAVAAVLVVIALYIALKRRYWFW